MTEKIESIEVKNISTEDGKKIIELIDEANLSAEKVKELISKEKVKIMTEEEKKIDLYLEKHKGENLTYKDAVLACLNRSEPEPKVEFTEEEERYIQEEKENLEKIEKYIEENPEVEYRTAVLTVLGKDELNESEKKVEEFIKNAKKQEIQVSYREAVLAVLDKSESEPKKEE